ncbi:MAG TPA: FAD-dependent oxidoreductase, partial [Steroidobacter sp.]|nr:FAD-dependent oxidoreductase [Steroidobacter sp.]
MKRTPRSEREQQQSNQRIDRRSFFRGAAGLSVGGVASFAPLQPTHAFDSIPESGGATAGLAAQTQRVLRWAGQDAANWVRPRAGADHNVVIVGGGQSGVAIAYGLRRKGIGQVDIIDQSDPGQAGIWRNVARMRQLRTPKTWLGPAQNNPALSVQAWYEALHGQAAFDRLDRMPRLAWADYLDWLQQVAGVNVRYRTRLVDIEPVGDLLRLHLDADGVRRTQTTRKLVLAGGYTSI